MKDLIEIRLQNIPTISQERVTSLKNVLTNLVSKAKKLEIWDDSITSIVITNNFNEDVYRQAKEWDINSKITKEKEYSVISKILFNHDLELPEHILFIEFSILLNEELSLPEILFSQIIAIKAKWLFPKEILQIQFTPQPRTLKTYITVSAIEWIKTYYTVQTVKQIFKEHRLTMDHNSFLTSFKRSLKKDLFQYNSDILSSEENLSLFWENYKNNIHKLFLRISENETDIEDYLINKSEECRESLYNVFDEIKKMTSCLIEHQTFDISKLKENIKIFSSLFEIHLEDETEENFRIRLTKNPKNYFQNLVDTEPRIVCFIDILGFGEFVNQYDNDITSTFLQDLQESFALASEHLLDNRNVYNKEAIEHLEYQTFSDNICISIPYFDNENDFLSNLNILSIYVRGLQMVMMSKGFFVRGGVSVGSYYADKNIIFSKGLINAYKLESEKAIYPRILIDKWIIEKILSYRESKIDYFGLKQAIIFDWENQPFFNPIGLIDSSISQFSSVLKDVESDSENQFYMLFNSLAKTVGQMTSELLEIASIKEKESLSLVKGHINRCLQENLRNEKIYTKYLWIKELFMWLENEGTEKLKFYYLSDRFKTKT